MRYDKISSILFYIAAALFYLAAIVYLVGRDTSTGIVWLCLGSTFLCLGSAKRQKSQKNADSNP